MKKVNIICSVLGLLLCAYIWISSAAFPTDAVMKIGPDFFPRIMATGMGLASLALLIQTMSSKTHEEAEGLSFKDEGIRRAVTVFVAAILYVVLLDMVGFIIMTVAFMMFMMYKLQFRQYFRMFLISLITSIAVIAAFQGLLDIQLPMGVLEPLMETIMG